MAPSAVDLKIPRRFLGVVCRYVYIVHSELKWIYLYLYIISIPASDDTAAVVLSVVHRQEAIQLDKLAPGVGLVQTELGCQVFHSALASFDNCVFGKFRKNFRKWTSSRRLVKIFVHVHTFLSGNRENPELLEFGQFSFKAWDSLKNGGFLFRNPEKSLNLRLQST